MPEIKIDTVKEVKEVEKAKSFEGKLTEAEHQKMSKKNPFGDFSSFEESIDQMQPILPDENMQKLVTRIEDS